MEPKNIVRERGQQARSALNAATRTGYNERIVARCQAELDWDKCRRVMLFLPMASRNEVDARALMEWLWNERPEVQTYLPRVAGQSLEAMRVTPATGLVVSGWGVPEPAGGEALGRGAVLDLILTPLLGFDDRGHRVGYGGGFYDRFFAAHPGARRVGLAYEALRSPAPIEVGAEDRRLHAVVTEARMYKFE